VKGPLGGVVIVAGLAMFVYGDSAGFISLVLLALLVDAVLHVRPVERIPRAEVKR